MGFRRSRTTASSSAFRHSIEKSELFLLSERFLTFSKNNGTTTETLQVASGCNLSMPCSSRVYVHRSTVCGTILPSTVLLSGFEWRLRDVMLCVSVQSLYVGNRRAVAISFNMYGCNVSQYRVPPSQPPTTKKRNNKSNRRRYPFSGFHTRQEKFRERTPAFTLQLNLLEKKQPLVLALCCSVHGSQVHANVPEYETNRGQDKPIASTVNRDCCNYICETSTGHLQ